MSMQEWETKKAVLVECWRCDRDFFIPFDDRGKIHYCPYCGNQSTEVGGDGLATQGRAFEVEAK